MKSRLSVLLHALFLLIFLVELAGRFMENIQMEYWVKPLIMPWIAVYFLLYRKKRSFSSAILLAFFFSWVGDILLMFSGGYGNPLFFYAGVGGFFLAQCAYIIVFVRRNEFGGNGLLGRQKLLVLPFALYLGGMLILLLPGMEGIMKLVISLYALTLLGMSAMALNRKFRVNLGSFRFVFVGSVLFVLSDSMIALDKFYMDLPLAGFWIMLTYMTAQYLIMRGLVLEE